MIPGGFGPLFFSMKRLLIFIYSFLFIFSSIPVSAADSTNSSEDSNFIQDVCFTLFDVLEGMNYLTNGDGTIDNPRLYDACASIVEMSGNVVESGKIAVDVLDSCIDKSLLSVASSFMATGQDLIDDSIDLMRQSDELMRSIWFYPSRALFQWDSETVKKGVDVVRPLFEDEGLVRVDNWIKCSPTGLYYTDSPQSWVFKGAYEFAHDYYACWVKYNDSQKLLCFANFDSTGYIGLGINTANPTTWRIRMDNVGSYGASHRVIYSHRYDSGYDSRCMRPLNALLMGMDIPCYNSWSEAWTALAGGSPNSKPVPNGKGYFRPLPEGEKVTATAKNVFNTDFNLYITNNYNTYGDNFTNVPVETYPYTKPNPETPSWWYDLYTPAIDIPQDDLSDLSNIDLTRPDLSVNNSFVVACFSAIPEQLSLLFISLSVLGAAFFIFKKG